MNYLEILVTLIVIGVGVRVYIGLRRGDKLTFGTPTQHPDDLDWHHRQNTMLHNQMHDGISDTRGPD